MLNISEEFYVSDTKGNKYLVQVWRESFDESNSSGHFYRQGLPHYKLKDGSPLNTDDGKIFFHYATNERFTKIAP